MRITTRVAQVLSGEDPYSFNPSTASHRIGVFFVPQTWFHDRKTDGTWPMPKKLIKGSKCLRSTSRWDHLASSDPTIPAVCRWAKCLGCCRSDMEDGEWWGQTAKRVERILARLGPRVVNCTLLMGQPSKIYQHLAFGNAVKASILF